MNGPIAIRAVPEATKMITPGKMPGSDGLLGSYCKCFEDKLL